MFLMEHPDVPDVSILLSFLFLSFFLLYRCLILSSLCLHLSSPCLPETKIPQTVSSVSRRASHLGATQKKKKEKKDKGESYVLYVLCVILTYLRFRTTGGKKRRTRTWWIITRN